MLLVYHDAAGASHSQRQPAESRESSALSVCLSTKSSLPIESTVIASSMVAEEIALLSATVNVAHIQSTSTARTLGSKLSSLPFLLCIITVFVVYHLYLCGLIWIFRLPIDHIMRDYSDRALLTGSSQANVRCIHRAIPQKRLELAGWEEYCT